MQTQGVTKSQVRSIFIYQGLLVGLVGTLIGAVLGVLITLNLGAILSAVNPNGVFLPTSIEPVQSHYCDCLFFIVIFIINHLSSLSCGKSRTCRRLEIRISFNGK